MTLSAIVDCFCKLATDSAKNVEEHGLKTNKRWLTNKKPILLNKKVIDALQKAEKDLPKGYSFLLLGGFRSLEDQTKMVKEMEKKLKKSDPDNWEELLDKYTGGYKELELKPGEISHMNHRSGNAIDITLMLNGKELDMGLKNGSATKSDKDKIDSKRLSKKIRENRKLLKKVLQKHGFENYKDEWWHWGYRNK